jgi:hypothetical protein
LLILLLPACLPLTLQVVANMTAAGEAFDVPVHGYTGQPQSHSIRRSSCAVQLHPSANLLCLPPSFSRRVALQACAALVCLPSDDDLGSMCFEEYEFDSLDRVCDQTGAKVVNFTIPGWKAIFDGE